MLPAAVLSRSDAYGSYGSYGKDAYKYKDVLPEWTVTMDVKFAEAPPREGASLLHTALIHAEETKGRTKLKPTEGEAVVNCDGGVGQLGTFGDVTKAAVTPGKWHRVVVAVKVAAGEGKTKGELRTWVDTAPGCVLKSEAVVAGGRFELDLDGLFLFSSSDPNMMPGGVSLRTVRVEQTFATDAQVFSPPPPLFPPLKRDSLDGFALCAHRAAGPTCAGPWRLPPVLSPLAPPPS